MEIKNSKKLAKSDLTFMLLFLIAIVLFAIFVFAYFKSLAVRTASENETLDINVAADEGTIVSLENSTNINDVDLSSIEGIYIAGYNDFEILNAGVYSKLNLIDSSFIIDEECQRVVNSLALAAIKLDNDYKGYYYNIQPAITDLYGGSTEVELKEITDLYNYSFGEILASEVVIDKTQLSVTDQKVYTENELLPEGCKLEQKTDGVLVLTIPQYQERITFHKVNINID